MQMFVPGLSRTFTLSTLTVVALFFVANFTDLSLINVFAPASVAARAGAGAYRPADMPSSGNAPLDSIILSAGKEYGVDPRLIHEVIRQESNYDAAARSTSGARGLMQMMPATARRFDCQDVTDERENVAAGTRYLRWLLERFDGDVALALAAYNAGEGSVDKYDGVPPFGQTRSYVRHIVARYGKTFHPLLAPAQARVEFRLVEAAAI